MEKKAEIVVSIYSVSVISILSHEVKNNSVYVTKVSASNSRSSATAKALDKTLRAE
jgi:ABC-type uncharacterized transport system auxiliary subunit